MRIIRRKNSLDDVFIIFNDDILIIADLVTSSDRVYACYNCSYKRSCNVSKYKYPDLVKKLPSSMDKVDIKDIINIVTPSRLECLDVKINIKMSLFAVPYVINKFNLNDIL